MKKTLKQMGQFGTGLAGFGVSTAVVAGVSAKSPTKMPGLSEGMNTAAGFTPIMGTAMMGSNVVRMTKGMTGKKKRHK